MAAREHTVHFIDPLELNLPLLDRMYKEIKNPQRVKGPSEQNQKCRGIFGHDSITNHSTSAAMKNTLDYFLEEYFFKPLAIVSYSAEGFGGVNAAQYLRLIFAELEASSISYSFAYTE